jgi:hypothetical protein
MLEKLVIGQKIRNVLIFMELEEQLRTVCIRVAIGNYHEPDEPSIQSLACLFNPSKR